MEPTDQASLGWAIAQPRNSDSDKQVWPDPGLGSAPDAKEYVYTPPTASTATPGTAPFSYAPPPPSDDEGRRRQRRSGEVICGVPHKIFWALVSVLLFVVIAAVGIGAGVGVSLRNSSSHSASGDASSPSTTVPPATSSAASPGATATTTTTAPTCPGGNGTFYSVEGSGFLVLCGRDYSGQDVALDIKSMESASLADCVRACALERTCTGAGFGPYPTTTYCWLKGRLNLSAPTWTPSWSFAVKLNQ